MNNEFQKPLPERIQDIIDDHKKAYGENNVEVDESVSDFEKGILVFKFTPPITPEYISISIVRTKTGLIESTELDLG